MRQTFDLTHEIIRPLHKPSDIDDMLESVMAMQAQLAAFRSQLEGWKSEQEPSASDILFEALKPPTKAQMEGWVR
jgi:hypothetical protein